MTCHFASQVAFSDVGAVNGGNDYNFQLERSRMYLVLMVSLPEAISRECVYFYQVLFPAMVKDNLHPFFKERLIS